MLKTTSDFIKGIGFTSPGVLINENQSRVNIRAMIQKAHQANAVFRPHFKTHQNAEVGRWFAQEGVRAITVSSVAMAEYFADHGWDDISIAFLLNPLQWPRIEKLARELDRRGGRLGLTVDSLAAAASISSQKDIPLNIWLKVDAGYGRTGVHWQDTNAFKSIIKILGPERRPRGLLTHSGHSYQANSVSAILEIWNQALERLQSIAHNLPSTNELLISVGDTPGCRSVEDLTGADEIRPGNFVFFDLMQWSNGVCETSELAAAAVCPVVGLYPKKGRVVLHGGAVHLSREFICGVNGESIFGYLGMLQVKTDGNLVQQVLTNIPLTSLSQEHGTIEVSESVFQRYFGDLNIGDLVLVWPVHSCLLCDLASEFRKMNGAVLNKK